MCLVISFFNFCYLLLPQILLPQSFFISLPLIHKPSTDPMSIWIFMTFLQRLIEYSLSVNEQYHTLPVVLAICAHNVTSELLQLTTTSDTLPFLLDISCHGWAQQCYLMNARSIAIHIQDKPLHPFIAVGHFLIEKSRL